MMTYIGENMLAKEFFIEPNKIELIDGDKTDENGLFYGGIQYIGECLDNLLNEIEVDFNTITVSELLDKLDECNVKIKNINQVIKQ